MGYDANGNYDGVPNDAGSLTAPSSNTTPNSPGVVVTGDSNQNTPNNQTNSPSGNPATAPGLTDQTQNTNLSQFPAAEANPLDKYASFNCLFTLACLSPNQQNGGKFSSSQLTNVIISSKGDWGKNNRATTIFGQFDYFIDDVLIANTATPNSQTGSTFATKITFKVIEPYSMGLFLLALNEGSTASSFKNFREAPYLLMIEFAGFDQTGKGELNPALTRYIPIKFIKITFKVTQAGSVYECEAIPYNHVALQDKQSVVTVDTKLEGDNVKDLLTGPVGLLAQVRKHWQTLVANKTVTAYDQIDIQFPKDFQDPGDSGNEISKSVLFKDLNDNGTVQFPANDEMFDTVKQIYTNSKLKAVTSKNMTFSQGLKIEDIISEVVMRSDYIAKQLLQGSIKTDEKGMMHWFRIETQVMDLDHNASLGRQNRKLIYRVVPYDVHVEKFLPPDTKPPGYDNLKKTVSRVYNYIYTGLNTEILSVDLQFNMAFFADLPADATGRTAMNNSNQGGPGAGGKEPNNRVETPTSSDDTKEATTSVGLTANKDSQTNNTTTSGTDGAETRKVKTMNALLAKEGEMIELKLNVMGDPYYITSSGMGNQIVPQATSNKLTDGSMNIQSGQVDFIINFRTPVDLDPATGLYKFDRSVDMWSGLYLLLDIESRFNHNKFTQVLRGSRRRQQVSGSGPIVPVLGS